MGINELKTANITLARGQSKSESLPRLCVGSKTSEDLLMKESVTSGQVFLSYARTDKHLAHALSRELKQNGLRVWDDQCKGVKSTLDSYC